MADMPMSVGKVDSSAAPIEDYRSASLMDLVAYIIEQRAARALEELVSRRRLFVWGAAHRLLLGDYLFKIREEMLRHSRFQHHAEVIEKAYDLTLDKFTRIPQADSPGPPQPTDACIHGPQRDDEEEQEHTQHPEHTDCRHYYRAFLERCRQDAGLDCSALEQESACAATLQRFVLRHFYYSCAEAARQGNPFTHRYTWRTGDAALSVYMPRAMTGKEKRDWLSSHIPEEVLQMNDRRERVQEIIDDRLCQGRFLPFDERAAYASTQQRWAPPLPWCALHGVSTADFAHALAAEKGDSIASLRPSIRRLGAEKLKALVLDIFQNLHQAGDGDGVLAKRHRLSKASYSRFAGSEWSTPQDETTAAGRHKACAPDLWKNMAGVLSRDRVFIEAAKAAGVWEVVQQLACGPETEHARGNDT